MLLQAATCNFIMHFPGSETVNALSLYPTDY